MRKEIPAKSSTLSRDEKNQRFNCLSFYRINRLAAILPVAGALLLMSNTALARDGAYVAFGLGQSDTMIGNIKYSGIGTAFLLGAQFNKNFALEFEYVNFGQLKDTTSNLSANSKGISGIFLLPLAQRVSIYFKLGVAQVSSIVNRTGITGLRSTLASMPYGMGWQYEFSPKATFRVFADAGYGHQTNSTTTISTTNSSFGSGIKRIGFSSLYTF